jgi:hypothetical protein
MTKFKFIYIFSVILTVFLFSCEKETSPGEEQSETFVKLYGGNGYDLAKDIIQTDSCYAVTGCIQTSDSGMQAFLMATDKYGNQLSWSPVLFGGKLNDCGNKIFKNSSGDFIIVGTTVKSYTATDSSDILVACISNKGILKWKKTFGGSNKEEGIFGICTSDDNIIFGGYTESYGNGEKDIYLYKVASDGSIVWSNYLGGSLNDIGDDIIQIESSLYLIGTTNSYTSNETNEVMVAKISESNGKPISVNYFPLDGYSLEGLKIDTSSNSSEIILLAGSKLNSGAVYGSYIIKISDNLSKLWSNHISLSGNEYPSSLLYSSNTLDIIVNKNSGSNSFPFLYNLDSNGNVLSFYELSNQGNQTIYSAIYNKSDIITIVGQNKLSNSSQILIATGLLK